MNTLFVFIFTFLSPLVLIAQTYEQSYNDHIDELMRLQKSLQKSQLTPEKKTYVDVYAQFNFLTSQQRLSNNTSTQQTQMNGFQVLAGRQFAKTYFTDLAFRQFTQTIEQGEQFALKEFDFRLGYRPENNPSWTYKIFSGLTQRFFNYNNPNQRTAFLQETPMLILGGSYIIKTDEQFEILIESSARSPLQSSRDKGSIDFGLGVQYLF